MNENENLATVISDNISYYRKKANMTQSELAEKLNYSDKSISKWERGDGIPDIYILNQLAKLFGLTVNDFLTTKKKEKIANRFISKILITMIWVCFVWFIATIIFFVFSLFFPQVNEHWPIWLCFIYAIPISCILLIIFNNVYFKKVYNIFPSSILCWTIALSIYLTFKSYTGTGLLFIVAIPFQVMIALYYFLVFKKRKR